MGLFGNKKISEEELDLQNKINGSMLEDRRKIDAGYFIKQDHVDSLNAWLKYYKNMCSKARVPFDKDMWERYWNTNAAQGDIVVLTFDKAPHADWLYNEICTRNNTMFHELGSNKIYLLHNIYNGARLSTLEEKYGRTELLELVVYYQAIMVAKMQGLKEEKIDILREFIMDIMLDALVNLKEIAMNRPNNSISNEKAFQMLKKDSISMLKSPFRKKTRQFKNSSTVLDDGTLFNEDEKKTVLEGIVGILKNEKDWFFKISEEKLKDTMQWDVIEAGLQAKGVDADGRYEYDVIRELVSINKEKLSQIRELNKENLLIKTTD